MLNMRTQSVNVNRLKLIEQLKNNRTEHVSEFEAAAAGFQNKMIEELQGLLKKAKKGELKKLQVHLPEPINHADDYQNVIDMLEVSVDENIQLDSEAFRAYWKNEWNWTSGFKSLAASYTA